MAPRHLDGGSDGGNGGGSGRDDGGGDNGDCSCEIHATSSRGLPSPIASVSLPACNPNSLRTFALLATLVLLPQLAILIR